jgi:carbon-monoxide dehydrogenase large subunit
MAIGQSIRRFEDARFLGGAGRYVDDLRVPDALFAAFVRSPHAHAAIRSIDRGSALGLPGVVGLVTGEDWRAAGAGPLPCVWPVASSDGTPARGRERPVFAQDVARHVGDTVAMVIAATAAQALDAAEALVIDYDPRPAVTGVERAIAPDAPLIHANAPGNVAMDWSAGDHHAVERAMAGAARVIDLTVLIERITHLPIEPRAVIGRYDPFEEAFTLLTSSQMPHLVRRLLATSSLRVPEHRIRVVAPDVGGGFGQKSFHYPEEAAVLFAARLLGRPVRWTATRSETFQVDSHARAQTVRARMALDGEGRISAIGIDVLADLGAYLGTFGPAIPSLFGSLMLSGAYRIEALHARVRGVYTHTTPVDAMRGAGRAECAYVVERLAGAAARALGVAPEVFRRRNYIPKDAFPYTTPIGPIYDSGDYAGLLDRAIAMLSRHDVERLRSEARARDRLLGVGLATFVESAGTGPSRIAGEGGAHIGLWDAASVRVDASGKVVVLCGSHSHGQGHATTYRQIVVEVLGCPIEDIDIVYGDTASVPQGGGTYGSRSITVVGAAIALALDRIVAKARRIAAHKLECAATDLEFANGRFVVAGTDRAVGFVEIARAAHLGHDLPAGDEPGLMADATFDPEEFNYPAGAHACIVEVDPETGLVRLIRYVAVDDVGRAINPMIVEGQIQGGVVQGIGQAMMERVAWDPGTGQLLTGSLLDYGVPRADEVPPIEVAIQSTPSPRNPLGVKGAGESGTIAGTPVVVDAVLDALAPLGVTSIDPPLLPESVWRAIRDAKPKSN